MEPIRFFGKTLWDLPRNLMGSNRNLVLEGGEVGLLVERVREVLFVHHVGGFAFPVHQVVVGLFPVSSDRADFFPLLYEVFAIFASNQARNGIRFGKNLRLQVLFVHHLGCFAFPIHQIFAIFAFAISYFYFFLVICYPCFVRTSSRLFCFSYS